jgi:hypothetical protein
MAVWVPIVLEALQCITILRYGHALRLYSGGSPSAVTVTEKHSEEHKHNRTSTSRFGIILRQDAI